MTTNLDEIARLRQLANNGCLDSMYWLASTLLVSDGSHDRSIEASKWLFLSIYLGHEKSKAVLEFVNSTQDMASFDIAYQAAVSWLEEKSEDYENKKDISKWSTELYGLFKKSEDRSKRKEALKLVWNKS